MVLLGSRLIRSILIVFRARWIRDIQSHHIHDTHSVICLHRSGRRTTFHLNPGGKPLSADKPSSLSAPSLGSSQTILVIRSNRPP